MLMLTSSYMSWETMSMIHETGDRYSIQAQELLKDIQYNVEIVGVIRYKWTDGKHRNEE